MQGRKFQRHSPPEDLWIGSRRPSDPEPSGAGRPRCRRAHRRSVHRTRNALAESFFATLDCELLTRTRWATHAKARTAVFAFIEGCCNTRRRHSALGYLSPLDFERLHETAPRTGPARRSQPRAGSRPARAGTDRHRHRRCCGGHREGMMAHRRRVSFGSAGIAVARLSVPCPISPPGDVDLSGLWTPGPRRAASAGRRYGRPQSVGNLAGDRWRSDRRRGRLRCSGSQCGSQCRGTW